MTVVVGLLIALGARFAGLGAPSAIARAEAVVAGEALAADVAAAPAVVDLPYIALPMDGCSMPECGC